MRTDGGGVKRPKGNNSPSTGKAPTRASRARDEGIGMVVTGAGSDPNRQRGNLSGPIVGDSTSSKTGSGGDTSNQTVTAPGTYIPPTGQAKTAFGKQYDYNASGKEIWNNPDSLAADWLSFNGYNPMYNNGLTSKMQDYMSKMDTLYTLLGGGTQSIADFVDYASGMMQNAMTPGGKFYSPTDIASSLGIGQGQNTDFLQMLFNNPALSARQNADNYLTYFGNAMNGVMTPTVLNAMLGVLSAGSDSMVANANKNSQQDPAWQQLAGIAGGYFGV